MNLTINHIPENWNKDCSISFANWFKHWVKSDKTIEEDYNLIKSNK